MVAPDAAACVRQPPRPAGMSTRFCLKQRAGAAMTARAARQRSRPSLSRSHNGAPRCRRAPRLSAETHPKVVSRTHGECASRSCDDQCSPQQRAEYLLYLLQARYAWSVVCLGEFADPHLRAMCTGLPVLSRSFDEALSEALSTNWFVHAAVDL